MAGKISDFSHRVDSVLLEHKIVFLPRDCKLRGIWQEVLRPVILAKPEFTAPLYTISCTYMSRKYFLQ
jgi:hypothetical protein